MATIQAPLFSATGEAKGNFDLPEAIFSGEGSLRVLQSVIIGMQANQRRGTSSTKTRGFVSGGGRKPWKQKGTGNARSGSIRSPLWRGGGIIFGPLPRSYRMCLDQSKRLIALQTALSVKAKASELSVFDSIQFAEPKTREAQKLLKSAGVSGKALVVVDKRDENLRRAFANMNKITVVDAAEVNAWQLMAAPKVLFTKSAMEALEKRWPPPLQHGGPAEASVAGKGS